MIYKPGSVFLLLKMTTIHLVLLLPAKSCDQPSYSQEKTIITLLDLAPGGVYPAIFVTKNAVSFYLAFSPLPFQAVYFLWHFP